MAKAEATVEELVGMIERGELRLPEMQRRYVWRSTRVRDLLDSLYRGYPSGAILVWDSDGDVPLQKFGVAQADNPYSSTRLLLDGQQRLTSLSAVVRGKPVEVRGRTRPIELLFNLEHPEGPAVVTEVNEDSDDDEGEDEADVTEDELLRRFERMTFVVATKKLEQLPHWVSVSEVFTSDDDAEFLARAKVTALTDPNYKKYSQRLAKLRSIKKYIYRMDVLERSLSYDEVTEIFVRVNSLGAKLRSSDLALAQITAKWRGSLTTFQTFQNDCAGQGFDLDLGLHLKNMVAFATGQSRFLTVGKLNVDSLKSAWKQACSGMEFAVNFVKSNAGINSPVLLSSPFLLIALGYYGHQRGYRIEPDEGRLLRYWVLTANAKGRFSRGSSETILDQDLAIARDGGTVKDFIERLKQQVGRLDITPEELEGRNVRSSLFKTMFLAFRDAGAKDWTSNLLIAVDHSGVQHRIQFHHIFPKDSLKTLYGQREIDDIANLAFIGGDTNRKISKTSFSDYFPKFVERIGSAPFEAQCIPLDNELRDLASYKSFLSVRRQKLAERLNQFLGSESAQTGASLATY
ncbi:MAG TPA: DUF262 domain-containing protein [Hyphomicrobium sp.]|nr:DUF262 domain-containing protein [Hyphomicrobium sp.]